jgi:hypothetical protein
MSVFAQKSKSYKYAAMAPVNWFHLIRASQATGRVVYLPFFVFPVSFHSISFSGIS